VLATLHFLSEQVFGDSYLELLSLAVLISAFVTIYHHVECHRSGCHRLGRFQNGHLRLCARHHPLVPDDGKIGDKEIHAALMHTSETQAPPTPAAPPRH